MKQIYLDSSCICNTCFFIYLNLCVFLLIYEHIAVQLITIVYEFSCRERERGREREREREIWWPAKKQLQNKQRYERPHMLNVQAAPAAEAGAEAAAPAAGDWRWRQFCWVMVQIVLLIVAQKVQPPEMDQLCGWRGPWAARTVKPVKHQTSVEIPQICLGRFWHQRCTHFLFQRYGCMRILKIILM